MNVRALFMAFFLLGAGDRAIAQEPVTVRFAETWDGGYEVDGEFEAQVLEATAWQVLTDYEDLPRFVDSMKSSRILRRKPELIVEQQSEAHAWFFRRRARVVLAIDEEPPDLIRFTDIGRVDFKDYEGSWSLQPIPGGVRVKYHLEAAGGLGVPRALAAGPARRTVGDLLKQVRAEMERRGRL